MENKTSRVLTIEEVMEDSSLSEMLEAVRFFEKNKDKIFFPKKHMLSTKRWVAQKVEKIYLENPDLPLLKVIITSLDGLNDKMTPEMVLEITDFIIKKWQSLTLPKPQEVGELQFV